MKKIEFLEKLFKPKDLPVEDIIRICENGAWSGSSNSKKTYISNDGKIKLFFEGFVYEEMYEFFETACNVYYKEEGMDEKSVLFKTKCTNVGPYKKKVQITGSIEDVCKYIASKNIGFVETKS